jgi:hypothetical protein
MVVNKRACHNIKICLFYSSFKHIWSKIFLSPQGFWQPTLANQECHWGSAVKITAFYGFWLPFPNPNMSATPWITHKLSTQYCYICMYMAGASHAWITLASLTFQLPAVASFHIHPSIFASTSTVILLSFLFPPWKCMFCPGVGWITAHSLHCIHPEERSTSIFEAPTFSSHFWIPAHGSVAKLCVFSELIKPSIWRCEFDVSF